MASSNFHPTAFTGFRGRGQYGGTSFPFECNNCRKVGHKRADCTLPGGGAHRPGGFGGHFNNQHRGGSSGSWNRGGRGNYRYQRGGGGRGNYSNNNFHRGAGGNTGNNNNGNRNQNSNGHRANYTNQNSNQNNNDYSSGENISYVFHIEIDACFVGDQADGHDMSSDWILDSGASDHLVRTDTPASNIKELAKPIKIFIAKTNDFILAKKTCDIHATTVVKNKEVNLSFLNVLMVEKLKCNLLSISKLEDRGSKIVIDDGYFTIINKANKATVGIGTRFGSLYKLALNPNNGECYTANNNDTLWHRRLGHVSADSMKKLVKYVDGIDEDIKVCTDLCEVCVAGKQTSVKHTQPRVKTTRPLERIHSDLTGAIKPTAYNGVQYLMTFIDDYTHFCVTFGLRTKDEAAGYIKQYVAMATARFNSKIAQFRCDNGGEYVNDEIIEFFKQQGIQWELTIPYTSQLYGVAERMNRTIKDKARCMLLDSSLNKKNLD